MAVRQKRRGKKTVWEAALERAKLGLWDWDLRTGACFYSETWARMLGYAPGDLDQASDLWLTLTHPEDRERAVASGDRHLAGLSDIIETELRLRHKDGHWVWVLDRGGVVERDASGKPLRMVGVQTDITRQKAAETAIEQVNARFRLALAASGTGIWHHDIGNGASVWDERTREIFGIPGPASQMPAGQWHQFLHPDDKDAAERAHLEPLNSPEVIATRYRIVRRGGEVRHVESLLRFIADPHPSGQILGTVRDVTGEERRREELAYAAHHDALTGLLNRAAFDGVLTDHIASKAMLPLAVFYIDLDYFKALNDFAGHAAGDAALRYIAAGLKGCVPAKAQVARLGGDEFAVVVPNCDDPEPVARNILGAIRSADLGVHVGHRRLAASIGIALVRDSATTNADALACADDACYAAKASGRDRFAIFSDGGKATTVGLNAARMAAETMDALEDDRLKLYGQEIRTLGSAGETSGYAEVLARLVDRNGRLVPPGEFIPAAERFGVAPKLDRWIIRTALTRFGHAMGAGGMRLAFNLSAQTLSDPGLWSFVDAIIEDTGADHGNIVFEITETAAVTNFEAAERFVHQARERRCRVSLDDFGAGLSSFEYLRRFSIDSIKINGSFVEHMAKSRFDREIVVAINGIAKSLGYTVVAEKIEKRRALDMLREMGVEFGQGFLLHRPEPLENVVARFRPEEAGLAPGRHGRHPGRRSA